MKSNITLVGLTTLLMLNGQSALSAKTNSTEMMCRNKAKEVAAETYKNCVTEVKQSQVQNIRKEYEQKLNALKKHYDEELKKIAKGSQTPSKQAPKNTNPYEAPEASSDEAHMTDSSTIEIVEIPPEQE